MSNLPPEIQLVLAALALTAAITDLRSRRIPNWLVLPAILVGFGLNIYSYRLKGLWLAAGGFAVGFGVYLVLYLLHGMAAGDVKLMGAVGALVGWGNWLVIFVITSIIGGVLALVLMVAKRRFRKTLWNTAFIISELSHFRAPHLRSQELDVQSPLAFRLPHAVPVALGCLTFLGASLAAMR